MKKLSLLCAAGVFTGLILFAGGCAGGCGEEPSSSSGGGPGDGKGGVGPSGKGASGGEVSGMSENAKAKPGDMKSDSRFDTAKKGAKKGTALEQAAETAAPGESIHGPRFKNVAPADLPATLKGEAISRRSLVFERAPNCSACDLAEPAVAQTADVEFESYDFFRVDLGDVRLTTSTTLPIFLMYKGSAQTSQRAGLPFPREKTVDGLEGESAYRKRLRRWLRDALIQRDLNFGKH